MKTSDKFIFIQLCETCNPQKEFVILVSIKINQFLFENKKLCQQSDVNDDSKYVLKFIKIPFSSCDIEDFDCNYNDSNLALIFSQDLYREKQNHLTKKSRQVFLGNLMNEFKTRNINIRLKFPDIYTELCHYVDHNKSFTPKCLFPRDLNKNDIFMCLIIPDSENVNLTDKKNQKSN